MGLDTSHDCFHGPYSQFTRFRIFLAKQIGIPLLLMDGFIGGYLTPDEWRCLLPRILNVTPYDEPLRALIDLAGSCARSEFEGLSWEILRPDPIHILLNHSDCEGAIKWSSTKPLADRLTEILAGIEDDSIEGKPRGIYDGMYPAIVRFRNGLLEAHEANEDVTFG